MGGENTISATKLLVVEGNHERDFFTSWWNSKNMTGFQVLPIGGKTKLLVNLKQLKKQSAFRQVTSLVIIRDADDDPAGAFQSVCAALTDNELLAPQHPWQFTEAGLPRTAVVLLPQMGQIGALEELLLQTVQTDPMSVEADRLIQIAVDTLTVPSQRIPPPLHKRGKARVHAFLSTFEEPDRDQGKAALAGVWDFNHPALQPLLEIISQME